MFNPGRSPAGSWPPWGKRDVSFDSSLPVPERWFRPGHHEAPETLSHGHATVALNDQHAFLDIPKTVRSRSATS